MKCRHCGACDLQPVVDLGTSPPSNAFPPIGTDPRTEARLPLRAVVCPQCWLMQTEDVIGRDELFTADYAYFSSYSTSWLEHAERYVDRMVRDLTLGADDLVVEVASNDGYLLQYVQARGVQVLGIEPTADTAAVARERGISTVERFFGEALGRELAASGPKPKLMVANNVLAHVPDINDFVAGFAQLLADDGVATFEFPHLLVLLRDGLYDTIYHEHFSYLSLGTVQRIFETNGLHVVNVEELPTHGGSLRVHAVQTGSSRQVSPRVDELVEREIDAGLFSPVGYQHLRGLAERTRLWLRGLLEREQQAGRTVMAYGAAAKGTTLLNHAEIDRTLLTAVVDRNPAKQGRQIPGTGIPISPEDELLIRRPDTILILPWNLWAELAAQLTYASEWGAQFAVPLPAGRLWKQEGR
jgi:SAM-dependent methyltransferase